MKKICLAAFLCLITPMAFAQTGIFENEDFFGDTFDGGAELDGDTYNIWSAGSDIWGTSDGMYWLWNEITGDFIVSGVINWNDEHEMVFGDGNDEWRKATFMFRTEPTDNSKNIAGVMRNDEASQVQQRAETGGDSTSGDLIAKAEGDTNKFLMVRKGDVWSWLREREDGTFALLDKVEFDMPDTILWGPAVTAHNVDLVEVMSLSDLEVSQEAVPEIPTATAGRTLPAQTFTSGSVVAGDFVVDLYVEGPLDVTLVEVIPEGWELISADPPVTSQDGNVLTWELPGANGTPEVTYELRAGQEDEGVIFSGSVQYEVAGLGTIAPPVGGSGGSMALEGASVAFAPLLDQSTTLDGEISDGEYDGAYVFTFDRANELAPGVWLNGPQFTPEESSATTYVFHNDDFIFVGIDMTDPDVNFEANTGDAWRNDSIELYMDGDLSLMASKDGNNFGFQATVRGDGQQTGGNDAPAGTELANGGFASDDPAAYWNWGAKAKDDGSGYVVEYRVDKGLILDPLDRDTIGFDIGVNDASQGDTDRSGKWAWWHFDADTGGRKDAWDDERGWGTLELLQTSELPGVDEWLLY